MLNLLFSTMFVLFMRFPLYVIPEKNLGDLDDLCSTLPKDGPHCVWL